MGFADDVMRLNLPPTTTSFADAVLSGQATKKAEEAISPHPKGLDDPALRAKIAFEGDTLEEKQRAFRQKYPLGSLKLNAEGRLLFNTDLGQPFQPVDPSIPEISGQGGKAIAKEALSDVADLAGAAPQVAADIGVTMATRGAGGFTRIAAYGAGGAAAEAARQAAQSAAGTQAQTPAEIGGQVVGAGAGGLFGGTLGETAALLNNVARGSGGLSLRPDQQEAMAAGRRLGAPNLTLGQLDVFPTITRIENQAASVLPRLKDRYAEQTDFVRETMSGLRSPADTAKLRQRAITSYEAARNDIHGLLRKTLNVDPTLSTRAGRAISQTADEWWTTRSKDMVDALYANARSLGSPQFNYSPLLDTAGKLAKGVRAPSVESGAQITVNPVPKEIQAVLDDIQSINWAAPPDRWEQPPLEILQSLQQRLFDLTLPGREGERSRTGIFAARQLYGSISKVLDSATNGAPGWNQAWKAARTAARERFTDREHSAMLLVMNSDTASRLVDQIVTPGSVDSLKVLKRISTPEAWNKLKGAFTDHMLTDGINKTLQQFDRETLGVILNDFDMMEVRSAGKALAGLEQSGVSAAVQAEHEAVPLVRRLVGGESGAIHELNNLANRYTSLNLKSMPADSPFKRSLRAAIMDDVMGRVVSTSRGQHVISTDTIDSVLAQYRDSGALTFLTNGDIQTLRDASLYNSFVRPPSDVGASMHGAAASREIIQSPLKAARVYLENNMIGRLTTNERFQKWLLGSGSRPKSYSAFLRALTTMTTSITAQTSQDSARLRIEGAAKTQAP